MTKSELIDDVSARVNGAISKKDIGAILNAFTDSISENLTKGEPVTLIGFGTFKVCQRAARTGRNPRTGKELNIPARKSPSFSAGKQLKDAVNK